MKQTWYTPNFQVLNSSNTEQGGGTGSDNNFTAT